MSSLSSYISLLPAVFQNRYTASGHFVSWMNELLEELQERGFLSTQIKEIGCIVENDRWISKPSDLIKLERIWFPDDYRHEVRVEDVNNRFKLKDREIITAEDDWTVITSFSNYALTGMTLGYTGIDPVIEDELEDDLLLITAGTSSGLSMIIDANDATTANTTAVTFEHPLDAVLDGVKVTEAKIVPKTEYLMMKYQSSISEISAVGDEVPVTADIEKRLIPTWLRWCCERQAMATSNETQYWGGEVDKILYKLQASRLSVPIRPAKGRRLVGLENCSYPIQKSHPDYSEF